MYILAYLDIIQTPSATFIFLSENILTVQSYWMIMISNWTVQ